MIYGIIWYLIGASSLLGALWIVEGKITLKDLVIGLTVGGGLGIITFILSIAIVIYEYKDTKGWEDFWEQKIF